MMAGLALAAVLSACAPAFEPELSENFSRQAQQTAQYFFKVAAGDNSLTSSSSLRLQPANNFEPNEVTITTTGYETTDPGTTSADFNLYIDPALVENNIPGLGLYPAVDAAENGSAPITADTAVPLKYIATYSSRNTVVLKIPFTEVNSIKNKKVVLVLDPGVVSFNGPNNHRLNMDGNTDYGQADDIFIKYYSVVGNSGVNPAIPIPTNEPTGYYAHPPQYVGQGTGEGTALTLYRPSLTYPATASESVTLVGGTKIVVEGLLDLTPVNSSSPYHPGSGAGSAGGPKKDNFDKEIISKGFKFQKFNYDTKEWVDVGFTVSDIDTTNYTNGAFVVTFTEASKAYDMFRYSIDPYQIVEKNAVLGYRHRLSYDNTIGFSTWDSGASEWKSGEWDYVGSLVNYSTSADQYYEFSSSDFAAPPALAGIQGRQYITVTINEPTGIGLEAGSLYFDTASLTAKNVTVVRTYAGTSGDDRAAVLPLKDASLVSIGRNEFRIYLPADLKLVTNDTLDVYINGVKVNYKVTTPAPKTFTGVVLADPTQPADYDAPENGAIVLTTITVP
jgi:hypothetical protein